MIEQLVIELAYSRDDLVMFNKVKKADDDTKDNYLRQMWKQLNHKFFGNKLKMPREFPLHRGSVIGYWDYPKHAMTISDILFKEYDFGELYETLLHEMAHQATDEIDKRPEKKPVKGHGVPWMLWMRRIGLETEEDIIPNLSPKNIKKWRFIKKKNIRTVDEYLKQLNMSNASVSETAALLWD